MLPAMGIAWRPVVLTGRGCTQHSRMCGWVAPSRYAQLVSDWERTSLRKCRSFSIELRRTAGMGWTRLNCQAVPAEPRRVTPPGTTATLGMHTHWPDWTALRSPPVAGPCVVAPMS
jgi:hypothetical protein